MIGRLYIMEMYKEFIVKWGFRSVSDIFEFTRRRMKILMSSQGTWTSFCQKFLNFFLAENEVPKLTQNYMLIMCYKSCWIYSESEV